MQMSQQGGVGRGKTTTNLDHREMTVAVAWLLCKNSVSPISCRFILATRTKFV